MTAEEKAIKLVEDFKPYMYCYMGSGMLSDTYDGDVAKNFAKMCALIAVDEIVNVLFQHHEIDYWKQVKTEIELL